MDLTQRYARNRQTISEQDQVKLASSTVAVVGCGGLGGYISEELTRLGVGHLILIDADRLEASNLNRQIMATEQNLGEWKVEAARKRLHSINSEIKLDLVKEWFNENNGADLLQDVDLVCDALDTASARIALERVCHKINIPLVFASIAGWYGLLGVSLPGDYSVAQLFGHGGERGIETTLGNPPFTPAVLASLSVAEAVKCLLGLPLSLRHSWLQVDLLSMEFERFEMKG